PVATRRGGAYASPAILSSRIITLTYTLADRENDPVRFIRAFYSTNGGGHWLPAVPTTGTQTTNLATSNTNTRYTFGWDTFASNFFGQSDNVVVRIEAYTAQRLTGAAPGPLQRTYSASQTYPFRAR